MQRAAKTSHDSVKWSEIPKNHKSRELGGYRWKVEARLNGKRIRRFFQHDESEKRDLCIRKFEALIEQQAKDDREILADSELLKEAARSQRKLEPHGKSLTEAVDFYLEYLRTAANRDTTPLEKVISNFLEEKRREEVSELHLTDLRQRLTRFSKSFPGRAVASFTRNEISEWILSLTVGPQAKINQRRILHNLFQFAVDSELIASNPVSTAAKGIKIRRKKIQILQPDEVANLLSHCSQEILPAVTLMAFCGIRKDEVGRLEWQEIDWEDLTIEISGEKAKREVHARHVSISENAAAWIKPLAKQRGPIAPFSNRNTFTKALQDTRKLAGWKPGTWPNNALRKTFISCHYESLGSIDETAKQAGTSVQIIYRHYRKLIKQRVAHRLWQIFPPS